MATTIGSPSSRAARLPLVVRVAAEPALSDCWSVDISSTGIGLVAHTTGAARGLWEGSPIELTLSLPESSACIQARGVVAWYQEHSSTLGTLFGVRFVELGSQDRLSISRYIEGYRFHVVVLGSADEERRLAKLVTGTTQVHHAPHAEALEILSRRGDISALVVFGVISEAQLEQILAPWTALESKPARRLLPLCDLMAKTVLVGGPPASSLLRYFNDGSLFRVLPEPVADEALAESVVEACRCWGLRHEQLRATRAMEQALARERVCRRANAEAHTTGSIVYGSKAFADVLQQVRTVARSKVSVLLQGETGTGKELVAHAIHDESDRKTAPFVLQDCGALSETLLESELFGHVKGAFTGAVTDHAGLFVLADGGTVMLDEIENTTPALQAKLLRVIETGQVRPLGTASARSVNVRIVSAVNRDLEAEVEAGRLRRDLYYRLAAFPIIIPPLRARPDDVLPLARHFLAIACTTLQRPSCRLTHEVELALLAYSWPGNARELRSVIERAVVLTERTTTTIELQTLPVAVVRHAQSALARQQELSPRTHRALRSQLDAYERAIIQQALANHGGIVRRAAQELGESAVTLARRARRLGLLAADN